MRALGRAVAVLLAILAFVVTPPADAATRVLHFETTWLSANPNPGMPVHCMPSRTLQPAEGNYALGHGWANSIGAPTPISLGPTTYTWTDCLYPETGQYRHVTALTPANPALPTVTIESTHPISGADRNITWGSYLDDTAQATPSTVLGRATHDETTFLSANPNPGMPAHCMPSRTLQPAEGNYALGHGWAHSIGTPVPISLESAAYTWTDCLYPETGQYRHVTALTPANPALPTLKIESTHLISGADRDITWGSYLDDTAQATPSTILGRATHYKTTFLSANPNSGMVPHCMPPKVIELAEANYGWGSFWAGNTVYLDYPRLGLNTGKDTYTWGDCLYPGNGFYRHVSSLDPADDEHPDWPTAYVEQSWYIAGTDRDVTWGSFLDRFGDD